MLHHQCNECPKLIHRSNCQTREMSDLYSSNSIQAGLVLSPQGELSHCKWVMLFVCVESSTFVWTCLLMYETFVLRSSFWMFLFCFQGMLVEWGGVPDISQCDWLAVQKREFYPRWDPNLALGSQTSISRRSQFVPKDTFSSKTFIWIYTLHQQLPASLHLPSLSTLHW